MDISQDYDAQIKKHARFNFTMGLLDGSNFWLGYSFIAPGVILPLFVRHLTADPFLIGLVAVISSAGFFVPQLFTANWVEHLPRKKVLPINIGFFSERLPLILLGPAVMLLAPRSAQVMLIAFFFLFAWHSIGAGLIAVAWQDLIAKIIPLERRGRFMGWTNFLGTATGVLGAAIAAYLLGRFPFPTGFAISFGIGSVFVFLSWFFLALTREPPLNHRQETVSNLEYWRSLPQVIKSDPNFRIFLLTQVIFNLAGMSWGFQAVYVAQHWNLPDSQVGIFTAAMLIGQALVNLWFGPLADRRGYKIVIEISSLAAVFSLLLTLLAPAPAWLNLAFALRGVYQAGIMLIMMFALEFSGPDKRPTYIGLSNTIPGIASGLAPLLGGFLAARFGYALIFEVGMVLGILGLVLLRWKVKDPRFTLNRMADNSF